MNSSDTCERVRPKKILKQPKQTWNSRFNGESYHQFKTKTNLRTCSNLWKNEFYKENLKDREMTSLCPRWSYRASIDFFKCSFNSFYRMISNFCVMIASLLYKKNWKKDIKRFAKIRYSCYGSAELFGIGHFRLGLAGSWFGRKSWNKFQSNRIVWPNL